MKGEYERIQMAILKLGLLPSSKDGTERIVEWYLELEALLKEIIALDKPEFIGHEASCHSNMYRILRMFPLTMKRKLKACPGEGKTKLQAILDRISRFRSQEQEALIGEDLVEAQVETEDLVETSLNGDIKALNK